MSTANEKLVTKDEYKNTQSIENDMSVEWRVMASNMSKNYGTFCLRVNLKSSSHISHQIKNGKI